MRFLFILTTFLLFPLTAEAQFGVPMNWNVVAEPESVTRGGLVTVTLRGEIDPGWRLYAMDSRAGRPLRIVFDDETPVDPLGTPQQSQPESGFDIHFDSDYTFFTSEVMVTQVFRVDRSTRRGALDIPATVTFMLCNDEVCLPPRTQAVSARVRVN